MGTHAVTAVYEVHVARGGTQSPGAFYVAGQREGNGPIRVTCSMSRRGLAIEYGTRFRLDLELPRRGLRTIDRGRKEYRLATWRPDVTGKGVTAVDTGAIGVCRIDGLSTSTRRWELTAAPYMIEAWTTASGVADPAAIRELWGMLVPGAPRELASAGLPVDLLVRDHDDPGRLIGRVRLVSLRAGGELPCCDPPEGCGPAPLGHLDREPRTVGGKEEDDNAPGLELPRLRAAVAQPVDIAWSTAQPALDLLAGVVNKVAGVVGELDDTGFVEMGGQRGELGFVLDWWDKLEPRLRGGPDDMLDEQVIEGIKKLYLAFKVSNRDDLETLSRNLQARYRREVQTARLDSTARLLEFLELIGAQYTDANGQVRSASVRDRALRAVADPEWDLIAKPAAIGLGLTELVTDVGAGQVTRFIATQFHELHIELGSDPVIEQLEFLDPTRTQRRDGLGGFVRAVVHIAEARARFQFETKPSGNAESILCAIFTFGLCAAAVANSGDGHLTMSDVRLAFDIRADPTEDVPTFNLRARLNRSASSMTIAWHLAGFNLAENFVIEFADQLGAWDDTIRNSILKELQQKIGSLSLDALFSWPGSLNVLDGPPVRHSGQSFVAGSGAAYAALANTNGIGVGLPTTAQPRATSLSPMGLALSRRYLTAWSKEHLEPYEGTREDEKTDLFAELGVARRDAAGFDPGRPVRPPLPDDRPRFPQDRRRRADAEDAGIPDPRDRLPGLVENCEEPPQFGPSYADRLMLVRSAVEVVLPETPQSSFAGALRIDYRLRLEPVKRQFTNVARVIPIEVCFDLDGGPAGLPRRGGVRAIDAVVAAQVARRGLAEGQSAGRVARELAAIERERYLRAAERADGLIIDPVDGPPVPPPGLPDFPGEPPRMVCEPPHCEWFSGVSITSLGTYIDATVRVELPLAVGFQPGGGVATWLPEMTLRGLKDQLRLIHQGPIEAANGFERVAPLVLAAAVQRIVREDALLLLEGVLPTVQRPAPDDERLLLPSAAEIFLLVPHVLQRLVVFSEVGPAASRYRTSGEHVHWAVQIEENLTSLIR